MHIIISPFSSYDWYKLNSYWTCFQQGFIAQLVELTRSWVQIPLRPQIFFLGFLCNCLSCFTTAKITFTSIVYLQFIYYDFYLRWVAKR